jgi:hypothetical protein
MVVALCPPKKENWTCHSKTRFFTLAALLVLAISVSSSASETNCSNASLNGSYALHATREIKNVGPFAAVGRFVLDGNGNLSGTLWQRINGNNVVETLTGEYSVSSNCIVRDSWHLSLGETTTHLSVIQNNGTEYVILNNTSGSPSTVSGEAKRQ